MRKFSAAVLFLVTFSLFVERGDSLKCYVCRSDEDKGCDGSMNSSYSVDCPEKDGKESSYCRKIHQKLRFKSESKYTSIRECAYEKGPHACYFFKWVNLAYQTTCECDDDLCNRGFRFPPSLTILIFNFFLWFQQQYT